MKTTTISGKARFCAPALFKHDVTIEGTLRYRHLKGMDCGLFTDYESLTRAYPDPHVGMYALLVNPDSDDTFLLYSCQRRGEWTLQSDDARLDMLDVSLYDHIQEIAENLADAGHALSGFAVLTAVEQLPETPPVRSMGYLIAGHLYVFVGEGGDTADGRYLDCGPLRGATGEKGPKGDDGVILDASATTIFDDLSALEGKTTEQKRTCIPDGNALEEAMTAKQDTEPGETEDFGIYDESYHAILRLKDGHVMTKRFDSRNTAASDGNTASDFEITDEEGHVVMRIDDGHVKTKCFDSSRVNPLVGSPSVYLPAYSDASPSVLGGMGEVYAAYDALAAAYPMYFSYEGVIGKDATDTYEVRHYTLGFQQPGITDDRKGLNTNQWSDAEHKRRRLLVTSGCHPTEQPSMLGCYQAVSEILSSDEPWALFIKNNLVLDIVPLINPWGLAQSPVTDNNANDMNVNRTYMENIQPENTNIIGLISDLMPKGLAGVIDCHNGAYSDNDGYFVSKPAYKRWNYYCVLSQQLSSLTNGLFEQAFGTTKNHFHMWDASVNSGQLHEYANKIGLLGCTFELRNKLTQGGALFTKGAQITRALLINIINAFGTINN